MANTYILPASDGNDTNILNDKSAPNVDDITACAIHNSMVSYYIY